MNHGTHAQCATPQETKRIGTVFPSCLKFMVCEVVPHQSVLQARNSMWSLWFVGAFGRENYKWLPKEQASSTAKQTSHSTTNHLPSNWTIPGCHKALILQWWLQARELLHLRLIERRPDLPTILHIFTPVLLLAIMGHHGNSKTGRRPSHFKGGMHRRWPIVIR